MNALLWLNPYRWLLLGAAVAALLFGIHMLDLSRQAIGERRVQARWDAEKIAQSAAALAQSQANARETVRRIDRQTEAQNAHDHEIASARAAAAGADAAAVRLRDAFASAASCSTSSNPSTPGDSAATYTATAVLTDVQRRIDEAAGELARYADEARAAGRQCVAIYEALIP